MARAAAKLRLIDDPRPALPPPKPVDRPVIIDEFGRLDARLKQYKPLIDRHEQLRKQIAAWYENGDPEQGYSEDGAQFSVAIGPRAIRRLITDMAAVKNRLGITRFLTMCTLSLEKLDSVIPIADQADLVASDRTGPRTVKAVQKFTEAA